MIAAQTGRKAVYRSVTAGESASPFSFDRHDAMSNARAKALGFSFSRTIDWLPGAVAEALDASDATPEEGRTAHRHRRQLPLARRERHRIGRAGAFPVGRSVTEGFGHGVEVGEQRRQAVCGNTTDHAPERARVVLRRLL
ncbi:hypothetical protein [Streptomyces lancefieldiae]|uniref:hypothetical protein n=1 Tax=Streptomyces lancefieldiae TaxID=3075520 RepID=UPI0028891311|nr:hypothetical protein [Streptomyces sp. DSM 40712]